jgi:hydrogenase maturation protein HypF
MGLVGWVANTPDGALVEVEGEAAAVEEFLTRSRNELPPRASIHSLEATHLDPVGYARFEIRESVQEGSRVAYVLPDIATCDDCLRELRDPTDRRYGYPFTNCTNCGPRYSIILRLPYDRPHTTMARFSMCPECRAEYENPLDRRFHAQPNACPQCGPHVELWDRAGNVLRTHADAIADAASAVLSGMIVAVKGLGGFHLIVDATCAEAVSRLRSRKRREEKPLAVMCPNLDAARDLCDIGLAEERVLTGPERPIVLLRKSYACDDVIAPAVAPSNPQLGVMLPYTPLHHLLMDAIGRVVVATSGNLSDEPICTDEHEALERLADIADLFLVHDRPIARHVDDSVVRIILGREQMVRRARGYAPLPVTLPVSGPTVLAAGAHLKSAVALGIGSSVYVGQHVGDLDTASARKAHARAMQDLVHLYEQLPTVVATDMHPDYASTSEAHRFADELASGGCEPTIVEVQHHYAHVLSCMADNGLDGSVLGVAWDGTGLGSDGTVWGGEFLLANPRDFVRVAHLRPFRLPGGEKAMREPRRSAAGLLFEVFRADAPSVLPEVFAGRKAWVRMLESGLNSPVTTSAGRLFDAVAAIAGLRQISRFEGQSAMELEWAIRNDTPPRPYSLEVAERSGVLLLDWEPMIRAILRDRERRMPVAAIARGFHDALVAGIVDVAQHVGEERVVLSGGCLQNRYLTEQAVQRLRAAGLRPYWHQRVPPNDGGIALGQAYASAGRTERTTY